MSQAGLLQLSEQRNPTGQTFVVDEASTLTGIGIFFARAPVDDGYGIIILRGVTLRRVNLQGGWPPGGLALGVLGPSEGLGPRRGWTLGNPGGGTC